jgi:uncharacterized membrane protein YtjA (UPF0391 family)
MRKYKQIPAVFNAVAVFISAAIGLTGVAFLCAGIAKFLVLKVIGL